MFIDSNKSKRIKKSELYNNGFFSSNFAEDTNRSGKKMSKNVEMPEINELTTTSKSIRTLLYHFCMDSSQVYMETYMKNQ